MKALIKVERLAAPQGLQPSVHSEHLADCQDAHRSVGAHAHEFNATELVAVEPAHEGQAEVSAAADNNETSHQKASADRRAYSRARRPVFCLIALQSWIKPDMSLP